MKSFEPLMRDLENVGLELRARFERAPALWDRGRPGKWTAGQHADHLAVGLRVTNDAFEAAEKRLREGALPPPPARDPLQRLFVTIVLGSGWLPRGGRAPRTIHPRPRPTRDEVLSAFEREIARCRAIGERLSEPERDRLWVPNPFLPRWRYTFHEIPRVHAVHLRHHLRQIEELERR